MENVKRFHLPLSLEDARIKHLPHAAFYIPDFITEEEEQLLLNKVPSKLIPSRFLG